MIVGIDLGTTYSAVAFVDKEGIPRIIPNSEGKSTTPSAVMFENTGAVIVGEMARKKGITDGYSVIQFIKNEMGNPNYKFRLNNGIEYTPEDISAFILKKLKIDAEKYLGTEITKAVITVPAYFSDAQRKATQNAGMLAGLEVLKIINEPTAAAITFGYEKQLNNSNILVYDLGGGTFDASVVQYSEDKIVVKSTEGIRRLGGHFFDQEIVGFVIEYFRNNHGINLHDDKYMETLQELNRKAEGCKIELSATTETYITINSNGIRDKIKITREQFSRQIKMLYERTERIVASALKDAGYTWKDIDKILLVGGASRVPYIRERLRTVSGIEPSCEINPDEAVALGAAIQASFMEKAANNSWGQVKVVDVCSHGIGVVTVDSLTQKRVNSVIIFRNTQIPAKSSRKFFTSQDDQEIIELEVTEGEYTDVEDVKIIGAFQIHIPRGLKKGAEVEIEVHIDENQIVHVYTRILSISNFFKEVHINRNIDLNLQQLIKKRDIISKATAKKPAGEKVKLPQEIAKEFDKLIGMEAVKKNILSFVNEAKLDAKRAQVSSQQKDKDRGYNFMILGNPGTGKTTVARIIAKVLYMLEIRSSETFIEVDKSGLVGKYIGETEDIVKNIITKAGGGTLFIDEAYTLYDKDNPKDFGREALNIVMKAMEDQRDSLTVIFAGYKKQMGEMLQANAGLESRIDFIIEVPDYSDDELLLIADKIAQEKALVITDSGKKAIKECINRQRIDEKFGNARYIRTLINEGYRNLANRLADIDHAYEEMFKLEAVDFGVSFDKKPEDEIAEALAELESLIGLGGVKKQVNTIINSMKVRREMAERGIIQGNLDLGTMHIIFTGNPGTGKTTIARIIGKIYKALGILKRGDIFVECTRGDLVGKYQGHTAEKTKNLIKESLGGILFIDEAYALYQGENDSFGKEAIDTLIAEMENHRDKLMVILAGYKNQMNKLLDSNPGFKSRVNTMIDFEDYSQGELAQILLAMANQKGLLLMDGVGEVITELIANRCQDNDFGNARGVRNILETIIKNKNNRIAQEISAGKNLGKDDFLTIIPGDVTDNEPNYN